VSGGIGDAVAVGGGGLVLLRGMEVVVEGSGKVWPRS